MLRRSIIFASVILGLASASFGQDNFGDIIKTVNEGDESLREAVLNGNVERVKSLLKAGVDVNTAYENGYRPIYFAHDPTMVDVLLAHGAKLKFDGLADAPGHSPIEDAAEEYSRGGDNRENRKIIVAKLRAAGAEYTIITAIYMNDIKFLEQRLAGDASWVNKRPLGCGSPLRVAAESGRVEICKMLLEHKADPNAFEECCGYPIMMGALDYPDIVLLLIKHKANLIRRITWRGGRSGNGLVGDEATLLHHAVQKTNLATIKLLIAAGLDPNAADNQGQTPLHIAVNAEAPIEIIEFLLNNEASLELTDKKGRNVLSCAEQMKDSPETVQLLKKTQKARDARNRSIHAR